MRNRQSLSEYSVHTFANQPSFLVFRLHDLTRGSFSSELSNSKDDSKTTLSNTALLLCKSWTKFNNLLLRRREPRIPAMRAFSISKMDSHSWLLELLKQLPKLWNEHLFANWNLRNDSITQLPLFCVRNEAQWNENSSRHWPKSYLTTIWYRWYPHNNFTELRNPIYMSQLEVLS